MEGKQQNNLKNHSDQKLIMNLSRTKNSDVKMT